MQEVTRAGAASKATACENFFRTRLVKGHCNCLHDNASSRVEAMMLDQKPNTTILHRHRDKGASAERTSNGAIAVLLRGHAFRGSAHDTMETRKAAQVECSESVQRHIVEPFKRMGIRVDLYLTVYDTVEEALLHELMRPYRPHVVTITRLSAKAASQLVGLANAIHAFESAAALGGVGPYDAVVEMRLDLRLKMDFPQLLLNGGTSIGMAGSQADAMTVTWIAGVRFAWREIGGGWRTVWTPSENELRHASNASQHDMFRVAYHMQKERDGTFKPAHWLLNDRVPDTLMAWSGAFTSCVRLAFMLECTRGWAPGGANNRVGNDVGHRMLWQLRSALAIPIPRAADLSTSTPLGYLPYLGYLVPNGQFDSNPCRAACILNPVYDILPRQLWTVRSGMCTRPSDFLYDNVSKSICCPSADSCCPNSVVNCSSPRAISYDASEVDDRILGREGWLRHYASRHRYLSRPNPKICNVSDWGTRRCDGRLALTVTPQSTMRIQALWNATPWAPANDLPEDDDNCRMSHLGRCAASQASKQRDELGF